MAAWVLASKGLRVLMLEAGRDYNPYDETPMFAAPRDAPLRGTGTPDKPFGFYDATVDGGWQVPGEPYASAPGSEFMWWRSRMLGGRTNHWARNSFRMGPYDFKPRTRDGLGVDWPIEYDDLAPWYDKTEAIVGVYGRNDGLENHPDSSPGVLHKPPAPRVSELLIQAGCHDLDIPCVPARRAILTRPIGDRSACFYATDCGRGCSIGAAFQSTTSLLPMALATGNLTIMTNAMVYEVRLDDKGKADGVNYIAKNTGKHEVASGRTVVLAASSGETARILLNSKSALFPDGAGNSSGQVGQNLMDTVGAAMRAQFPLLENRPAYNEDGAMGLHMYIPFWLYQEQARGELDFKRGYHYEFGSIGRREPGVGLGEVATFAGGYGRSLKEDMRRYYGSFLSFVCRGEMIPNAGSYCEIDPDTKDRWGIPTLRFHFKWSENELKMVRHFQETTAQIIDRLGGRLQGSVASPQQSISRGGEIIHEVGTARMGDNPDSSVTNQFGQTWDINNLFLSDGSVFASKAHKNPTLTIMALAWRSSDYLAEQLRTRAL
ncbi:MAG: GMC family oxidoreductase [Proteobacteria bacterium]|nr:GMC family oxidoreductase [Pseudomonadota bacterium]MDA0994118.1 GMC family oxidoreductase [Pseudomonadota bacterium]